MSASAAFSREVGGRLGRRGSGCCGGSLAAEDVFYMREEVVECCHFFSFFVSDTL